MTEPAFKVKKLDVIVALLLSHVALDVMNPSLISGGDLGAKVVVVVVAFVTAMFLSALAGRG